MKVHSRLLRSFITLLVAAWSWIILTVSLAMLSQNIAVGFLGGACLSAILAFGLFGLLKPKN